MIIEKQIQTEQPEIVHEYYEVYEIEEVKDVDDKIVQIKKLIETVSKNQVEARIKEREKQIENLQNANLKDQEILTNINK